MNNIDIKSERRGRLGQPSAASPEEISSYIAFQLSELSSKNGHHDFEHLCTHLGRRRICPNVLPSTGPVAGGGDQGSDSESYSVTVGNARTPFFAAASRDKVVFACSLEKNVKRKIEHDLKLASELSDSPSKLYFFTTELVQTGTRHKLQKHAKDTFGIHLEIFDRRALSDMLADREVFWIAQRYLSIPSELMPPVPASESGWYAQVLARADTGRLSDFIDLKYAVRRATFTDSLHSDIPSLIERLKKFLDHPLSHIQRKAFYEIFVASLRGLELAEDHRQGLHKYFSVIPELCDGAELEDATILLQYCYGAEFRGLLTLDSGTLENWRRMLLERLEKLLEAAVDPSRRCQLMMEMSLMHLLEQVGCRGVAVGLEQAVPIWKSILKLVPNAPMYPLERFTNVLSEMVVPFGENDQYRVVLSRLESVLLRRSGKARVARLAVERATSLYEAGKTLSAIEELHHAKINFFVKETACEAVIVSIFLAQLYASLSLHAAAELYALSAAYAAFKIDDDKLRPYASRALLEAMSASYHSGASLKSFLIARPTYFAASQYGVAGGKEEREAFWATAEFYLITLTYMSRALTTDFETHLVNDFVEPLGSREAYNAALVSLKENRDFKSIDTIAKAAERNNVAVPFSDIAVERKLQWRQLDLEWELIWKQTFENNIAGDMFAAYLQILLADVIGIELSLIPTKVLIELIPGDAKPQIEQLPDNEVITVKVALPKTKIGADDYFDYGQAVIVAAQVLRMVSALTDQDFKSRYEQRLKAALMQKMGIFAPYEVAYREFVEESEFEKLWAIAQGSQAKLPTCSIQTDSSLDGPHGLHPLYDPKEATKVIAKRYSVSLQHVRPILDRYLADARFVAALKELSNEGWKDWHLLMAISNVQFTHSLRTERDPTDEQVKNLADKVIAGTVNAVDDMAPISEFNAENLRIVSKTSQLSTLKGLGLTHRQRTPNFEGINKLLSRFRYWEDDIPHDDPFAGKLSDH